MKRNTEKNIFQSRVAERPLRKCIKLPICLISDDKRHSGHIINISCHGLGIFINTKFHEGTINCRRGSVLKLELKTPLQGLLVLRCRIAWLRIKETPPDEIITSIGMEVVNPPKEFLDFFSSLVY